MRGKEGDLSLRSSPGRRLEKLRHRIYAKELLLLTVLKQHLAFTAWEPSIGGKFPRQEYSDLIVEVSRMLHYIALMSYATQTFSTQATINRPWQQDLNALIRLVRPTSQHVTSLLSLLAASVHSGNALPPYLEPPSLCQLSEELERLDRGILSSKHIEEPGYSAYAVMHVASNLVTDDLRRIIKGVQNLVGVVDFDFEIVSTSTLGSETGTMVETDEDEVIDAEERREKVDHDKVGVDTENVQSKVKSSSQGGKGKAE
jgi:hypothetical protein